MRLYAIEYSETRFDGSIREKHRRVEVTAGRFLNLIKQHKDKRGFKGVYAI